MFWLIFSTRLGWILGFIEMTVPQIDEKFKNAVENQNNETQDKGI